jgi:hypothetical protein
LKEIEFRYNNRNNGLFDLIANFMCDLMPKRVKSFYIFPDRKAGSQPRRFDTDEVHQSGKTPEACFLNDEVLYRVPAPWILGRMPLISGSSAPMDMPGRYLLIDA